MKDYTNDAPQFADKIKILEPTDPGHADNFNPPVKQLLQNTLVLKNALEESKLMGGSAQAPNRLDVMQEKIEALQVPEIPEPSEEDTRENISQGDDQPTLWKKVKRWFADLKAGAFASIVNNCTTTEEGTVLDGRQGKVLQDEIDELKEADSEINSNIPFLNTQNLIETIQLHGTNGNAKIQSWVATKNCFACIGVSSYNHGQCNVAINGKTFGVLLNNSPTSLVSNSIFLPLKEGTEIKLHAFMAIETQEGYADIDAKFYSL